GRVHRGGGGDQCYAGASATAPPTGGTALGSRPGAALSARPTDPGSTSAESTLAAVSPEGGVRTARLLGYRNALASLVIRAAAGYPAWPASRGQPVGGAWPTGTSIVVPSGACQVRKVL